MKREIKAPSQDAEALSPQIEALSPEVEALSPEVEALSPEVIDATVASALRILTAVEPPSGMQTRILSHLQQRAQSGPSTLPQRLSELLPQLAIGAATAACLLAVGIILRPDHLRSDHLRPDHRQPAAPPVTSSAAASPSPSLVSPVSIDRANHQAPSPPHEIHRTHPASAPARLVSFPAPPEPLTKQEQLLLVVAASHPSPEVIAALDPVQRAEAAARSEQQFLASLQTHDSNANTPSGDSQ